MSATPAPTPVPDYSEDNLVRRSGYYSTLQAQRYDQGGYDFMAVAYFARWAGPVLESSDPYDGHGRRQRYRQARAGRRHDPRPRSGRWTTTSSSSSSCENGALSVGMCMALRVHGRLPTNAYYDPYAEGENHGV